MCKEGELQMHNEAATPQLSQPSLALSRCLPGLAFLGQTRCSDPKATSWARCRGRSLCSNVFDALLFTSDESLPSKTKLKAMIAGHQDPEAPPGAADAPCKQDGQSQIRTNLRQDVRRAGRSAVEHENSCYGPFWSRCCACIPPTRRQSTA